MGAKETQNHHRKASGHEYAVGNRGWELTTAKNPYRGFTRMSADQKLWPRVKAKKRE